MFRSLLSQIRLSSVCHLSDCNVGAPYSGLNLLAIFLHRCIPWPSSDLSAKFYGDRPRGTPSSGALNIREVAIRVILDLLKPISHKRCKIDVSFLLKTNRKSYALYRMVILLISLGAPKPPHFLHFATHLIFP